MADLPHDFDSAAIVHRLDEERTEELGHRTAAAVAGAMRGHPLVVPAHFDGEVYASLRSMDRRDPSLPVALARRIDAALLTRDAPLARACEGIVRVRLV